MLSEYYIPELVLTVACIVLTAMFTVMLTHWVFSALSLYISMGQLSSVLAEFTETWEVRMSALQAWKEDVMATNQQVKPLRSAAIKQLASTFVGRPTNVK